MNNQLKRPIRELENYVVGDGQDICAKLEENDEEWIKTHLADQQTIRMFAQECLGELWSLRVHNSLDAQKYQAAVIYRWFTRLEQFVQRGGDPSFESKSADKH